MSESSNPSNQYQTTPPPNLGIFPLGDFGPTMNPILHRNVFSRSSRNIFGPVSLIPTRFLTQLRSSQTASKKDNEDVTEMEPKAATVEHKFLLKNLEIPLEIDEISQESLETQRAFRAEFVKMLMLATTQDN